MEKSVAQSLARTLWQSYVSLRPAIGHNGYLRESQSQDDYQYYDLEKLHDCILGEHRSIRKNPGRVTAALAREVKGDLVKLGKIRKALAKEYKP